MAWWDRLIRRSPPAPSEQLRSARFTLRNWFDDGVKDDLRVWRDPQGAVLSLAVLDAGIQLPASSDIDRLHVWCRSFAEHRSAGLIDCRFMDPPWHETPCLIYKRLEKPAYIYTGMAFVSLPSACAVLTLVDGELGTTGVREAVATTELMNSGQLTLEEYESRWAQDPFDEGYRGVDRSVLRFLSDDERYDDRFPDHPLSKVRGLLVRLPHMVELDAKPIQTLNGRGHR